MVSQPDESIAGVASEIFGYKEPALRKTHMFKLCTRAGWGAHGKQL
jgi:hypothetical protein